MRENTKLQLDATSLRKIKEYCARELARKQQNFEVSPLQNLPKNETKSSNKTEGMPKEIVQDDANNVCTGHIYSEKIMQFNSHDLASNKSGPLSKQEKLTQSQKTQKQCEVISKKILDPEKACGTMDDQITAFFSKIGNIYLEPRLNTTFSNATFSLSRDAAVSSETSSSLSNQEIFCSTKLETDQIQTDLVDSSTNSNLIDFTECSKSEKEIDSVECSEIQNLTYSQKCCSCKSEATEFSVNDNEFDALQALQNPHGLQFGDILAFQFHTDSVNCPGDNAEDFSNEVLSERRNSLTGMCLERDEIECSSSDFLKELKPVLKEIESVETSKLTAPEFLEDNNTVSSVAKNTSKTLILKLSASTRMTLQQKDISFFIYTQKKKLPKYHTGTELSKAGFSEGQACSSEFHHNFITSDLSHTDSGVQSGISANPQVFPEASDSCLLPLQIFDDLWSVPYQASDSHSCISIQASDGAWDTPLFLYLSSDILFSVSSDNQSSVPSQPLDISSLILSQSPEISPFVSSQDSCSLSSTPSPAVDTTSLSSQAFVVSSCQSSFIIIIQSSLSKILMLGPFSLGESSSSPLLPPSQALNIPLLYPQASVATLSVSLQSSDSQQQTSFSSLSATSKSSAHSSLVLYQSSNTFPSQGSCSLSLIVSLTSGSSSPFSQAPGSSPVPSQSSCNSSLISSYSSGTSSSILSQAFDIPPLYSQVPGSQLLVPLRTSDTGLQASDSPLSVSLQAFGTSLSVPLQASDTPPSVTSQTSDTPSSVLSQDFNIPPLYSQAPDSQLPVPLQTSDTGLQASDSPLQASNTPLSILFQASDTQFQDSHTPLHASDTPFSIPMQASCNLWSVPSQISCSRKSVSSQTSDTTLYLPQARDSSVSVSSQFSATSSSVPSQDSNSSSLASSQDSDSLSSGVPQASDTSVSSQAGDSPLSVSMQFSGSTSVSLQASVGFSFRIPIISRIVKWILKKFWKGRRKLLVVVLLILITKAAFRIHHYIQQNGDVEFSYMQRCLYKYLSFIEFISVINKSRR